MKERKQANKETNFPIYNISKDLSVVVRVCVVVKGDQLAICDTINVTTEEFHSVAKESATTALHITATITLSKEKKVVDKFMQVTLGCSHHMDSNVSLLFLTKAIAASLEWLRPMCSCF